MKIKFINAKVLVEENQDFKLKNLEVLVDNEKICKIAENISDEADKVVDVKGNILMPGFVNAHAHNPMTLLRGIKSDVNLQTWLYDHIFFAEANMTEQDVYVGEMLGIMESLKAGITTIEENYFYFDSIIKAVKDSGVRARVAIEKNASKNSVTHELENSIKSFDKNSNLIKPVVYPHSIYTVTDDEMDEFVNFSAKYNLPVSTHLSETLLEVGNCIEKYKKTPPEYLEAAGFLDRGATLYHCVHMDKDDMEILKNYNASVVTCPSSNLVLGSGICPVNSFLNKDINIAIGTDGPASNNTLDMFKEMFLVASLQKGVLQDAEVVTVSQVLKMATQNGATALGFEKVGKIEQGYYADIILVDVTGLHHQPQIDLVNNLVYSTKSSDVYFTMVNGKVLYEDRKLLLCEDEKTIIEKAKKIKNRIIK
jgi:5-methylthioadenosine/S-adenosylhomocysteine deaminase